MQARKGVPSWQKNLFENCVDDSTISSGISNSCLVDLRMKIRIVVSPMKELSQNTKLKANDP